MAYHPMGLLLGIISLFYFYLLLPLSHADSINYSSMITLFSVECNSYFDWQTVGLMHSYRKSGQPGSILRLLSCTESELSNYGNMDLAPTFYVPLTVDPETGDKYTGINKPAAVVHWLNHHPAAREVEWVVILDADEIIRSPITPWNLGAEKGKPVSAYYGYLIGCGNILAQLHTKNPQYCDKVGGFFIMHIDDLKKVAPLWLSKSKEVREDKGHYATNMSGDVFSSGRMSEMYGYSFAAADLGLRHKICHEVMLYPGYVPLSDTEPLLLRYELTFGVDDWRFGKKYYTKNHTLEECNRLFPSPPFLDQIKSTKINERRRDLQSIECVNTINEGLLIHYLNHGCPSPSLSPYISLLTNNIRQALSKVDSSNRKNNNTDKNINIINIINNNNKNSEVYSSSDHLLRGKSNHEDSIHSLAVQFLSATSDGQFEFKKKQHSITNDRNNKNNNKNNNNNNNNNNSNNNNKKNNKKKNKNKKKKKKNVVNGSSNGRVDGDGNDDASVPNMMILFSAECDSYFDWQTLGLMYSYERSGQPGPILRLLSCTEEKLRTYRGMNLAPTMLVPSYRIHPVTGDSYPAINKPVAIQHWLKYSYEARFVDWVLILDCDMLLRYPITPQNLGAKKGWVISSPYDYLIGCDNVLAKLHINNTKLCDKVGGFYMIHIEDLRRLAPLWISKTEEVRADRAHYATNITGDIYGQGWISEMYGYSFGASEAGLHHVRNPYIMLYPGYAPSFGNHPKLLHLGLGMKILKWEFAKWMYRTEELVNVCGKYFTRPPKLSSLPASVRTSDLRRDAISKESVDVLNRALREYHLAMGCEGEGEMKMEDEVFDLRDAALIGNEGKSNHEFVNNPGLSFFVNKLKKMVRSENLDKVKDEDGRVLKDGNGGVKKKDVQERKDVKVSAEETGNETKEKRRKGVGWDGNRDSLVKRKDDLLKLDMKNKMTEMKGREERQKEMINKMKEDMKHLSQNQNHDQRRSQPNHVKDEHVYDDTKKNDYNIHDNDKHASMYDGVKGHTTHFHVNVSDSIASFLKGKRKKVFSGRNFFDKAKLISINETFISNLSFSNLTNFLTFSSPLLAFVLGFMSCCFSFLFLFFQMKGKGTKGGRSKSKSKTKSKSKSISSKQSTFTDPRPLFSLSRLPLLAVFSGKSKDTSL